MDELVNVAVPRHRLLDVYRLLAGEPPLEAVESIESDEPVDPTLIVRAYRESPDRMKTFLGYMADHAGRRIPNTEVVAHMGIERPQLAGVLGAFGRRWANRYKQRHVKWFFDAEWELEDATGEWKWHYGVSPEVAKIIKEATMAP